MLSHLLVALLVGAMVTAGLWQIDRHRERAERNEVITERSAKGAVPLAMVAPPGTSRSVGETEQFRRVRIVGTYQRDDEVLVRNRTFDGAPGYWVLTPLLTDEGWGVAINRGWIPSAFDPDAARPGTEAPAGEIVIEGWVQPSRRAEGFQKEDPATGVLTSLARPNVERLAQQLRYELAPVVVQLESDGAATSELPLLLSLPPLDGGPHASYAVQWFVFTTIAVIGYPLVLRRVASGRARSAPPDADESD